MTLRQPSLLASLSEMPSTGQSNVTSRPRCPAAELPQAVLPANRIWTNSTNYKRRTEYTRSTSLMYETQSADRPPCVRHPGARQPSAYSNFARLVSNNSFVGTSDTHREEPWPRRRRAETMRTAPVLLIASGLWQFSQQIQGCSAAATDFRPSSPSTRASAGRLFPLLRGLRDSIFGSWLGRGADKTLEENENINALRSRYAHELVLRFDVAAVTERTVLTEAAARLFLDIWAIADDFVDIRLRRDQVPVLLETLPLSLRMAQSTLIPDLATTICHSLSDRGQGPLITGDALVISAEDTIFFQKYQPFPVILRWMKLLEAMFPSFVEYASIGSSFEGRDIPALRLRTRPIVRHDSPRKTIIVTGGIHAREWISTTTVNYLAWSFITSFGKERMITRLLNEFDFVFLPVTNPDGMEYTWQVDRLWRKSRQQTSLPYCRGLDLDHTFGYGWYGPQARSDPCSDSYGGEEPFEAVEAAQLAKWARNETQYGVKFVGLLDLHSYSQQILFPFAVSCQAIPPNLENLEELAAGIAKAIRITKGEAYSVTSACRGLAVEAQDPPHNRSTLSTGSAGGSAMDWFYHEMAAHLSYQIKLRDTGSYGFLLPSEQIISTGEELFSAMKYFGDYLLGNNGIEWVSRHEENEANDNTSPNRQDTDPVEVELKRRSWQY